MAVLDNRIPPPIVAVFFGAAMWGLSNVVPGVAMEDAMRLLVTALVAVIGVFFCASGVISFRRAKTTVNPLKPEAAASLVISGIYQVTRNPMYVGFALLLVAWAVFLSSPLTLVGVAGFALYIDRFQIPPEERALSALFGEEFGRYKNSVRRWL